jgi:2-dehydro-3-deoxyphosphogluconate aldolase/(4S)-4-hydroxy-2-oxoglutarate aldolase
MSRAGTIAAVAAGRLLPVIVLTDDASAAPLAEALVAGGLRCAEVTFRTAAAEAALKIMAGDGRLLVGAGTVITPGQVDRAVQAGAKFIVSPGFSPAVVRRCAALGVPVFPGVATSTEIMAALDEGLEVVKFFPAEQLGGLRMLAALAAPFTTVKFIPTGGVTAAHVPAYLAHPAVAAVGGSWMVSPTLIAAADWAEITRRTAEAVAVATPVDGQE